MLNSFKHNYDLRLFYRQGSLLPRPPGLVLPFGIAQKEAKS